jgi:hypothetical protein
MIRLNASAHTRGSFWDFGTGGFRGLKRKSRSSLLDISGQFLHGGLGVARERLANGLQHPVVSLSGSRNCL